VFLIIIVKRGIDCYRYKKLTYAETARVGGHYGVQGHSRLLVLIAIVSPYVTTL